MIIATVIACTGPGRPSDGRAIRAEIEAANARHVDALLKGDVEGLLASYADDVVVMLPGQPAWTGRRAVETQARELLARTTYTSATLVTRDVQVAGDLAIETGSGRVVYATRGEGPVTLPMKYLTVWRREGNGGFRVIREINNSGALQDP